MARQRRHEQRPTDACEQAPPATDDDERPELASPACLMHEVDPVYMGLAPEPEAPPRARRRRRPLS
jgi:hypothetical protein